MDDVIDYIHTASTRIHFYKLPSFPQEFVTIADCIHSANKEIQLVLRGVKVVSDFIKFKDSCAKIDSYESEVDYLYQQYLSNLFEIETNAINLIKKRDILASLEKAIDKCDDVANVFSIDYCENFMTFIRTIFLVNQTLTNSHLWNYNY